MCDFSLSAWYVIDLGCDDTNNGATDYNGNDCTHYEETPQYCINDYDYSDEDFNPVQMCCVCGGGQVADPEPTGGIFMIV